MSVAQEEWHLCHYILSSLVITGYTLCSVSLLTVTAISMDRLLARLLGLRHLKHNFLHRFWLFFGWVVMSSWLTFSRQHRISPFHVVKRTAKKCTKSFLQKLQKFTRAHWLIFIVNIRQQVRAGNSTICYRKKQIDVSFLCVCPVIDHEFRHNIFKVVCESSYFLTMWWGNSWSITGQTHKKLTSIC